MSNMSELSAERDTYILANHSKGASGVTPKEVRRACEECIQLGEEFDAAHLSEMVAESVQASPTLTREQAKRLHPGAIVQKITNIIIVEDYGTEVDGYETYIIDDLADEVGWAAESGTSYVLIQDGADPKDAVLNLIERVAAGYTTPVAALELIQGEGFTVTKGN